ncbi:hypothetical protein ACRAWD_18990 [Caulobacter segnis]
MTTSAGCSGLTTPDATQISTTNLRNACLSQWYDYAPRTARYGVWTRNDERISAEFTAQYRFTDKIDAWVSYNRNERKQTLNDINYGTDFTSAVRLRNGHRNELFEHGHDRQLGQGRRWPQCHRLHVGQLPEHHGAGGAITASASAPAISLTTPPATTTISAPTIRGDRLQIEFQGSRADTHNVSQTNNVSVSFDTPGMTVTLDPVTGGPSFKFANGYSPSDAAAIRQWQDPVPSVEQRIEGKAVQTGLRLRHPPAVHHQVGIRRPSHRLLDEGLRLRWFSSSTAALIHRRCSTTP